VARRTTQLLVVSGLRAGRAAPLLLLLSLWRGQDYVTLLLLVLLLLLMRLYRKAHKVMIPKPNSLFVIVNIESMNKNSAGEYLQDWLSKTE
jgi:hypothetical protein